MPDASIFDSVDFNGGTEIARMKQAAYLTPGVTFTFINKKDNIKQRFYFE
jgi:DNA gyrase/topoisomerase IV subunit B